MRKSIIFFFASILFGGIFYYLINYVLLPDKQEGNIEIRVLDVKNLHIVSASFFLFLSTLISSIHMFIDKIFFRKFYQKERLFLAIRRSIIISLQLVGLIYLKIFGFAVWYNIILVVLVFILIEWLFSMIKGNREENIEKEVPDNRTHSEISKSE